MDFEESKLNDIICHGFIFMKIILEEFILIISYIYVAKVG